MTETNFAFGEADPEPTALVERTARLHLRLGLRLWRSQNLGAQDRTVCAGAGPQKSTRPRTQSGRPAEGWTRAQAFGEADDKPPLSGRGFWTKHRIFLDKRSLGLAYTKN